MASTTTKSPSDDHPPHFRAQSSEFHAHAHAMPCSQKNTFQIGASYLRAFSEFMLE